jgi:hypothetical protein
MPAGVTHTQARGPRAAGPAYRVELADVHAHLFGVQLRIARPAAVQRLSLPVWIPGSYLVREFARHLQGLQAQQGGMPVAVVQCDKCTWEVACDPSRPLELHYQVYAFDNSVRAAWLDAQRAFFNGTSLFLRVHGQEEQPHALALPAPRGYRHWQLATGLAPAGALQRGFGNYQSPPTTTRWSTARSRWGPSGARISRCAASRTRWWWPAPPQAWMATGWWPTSGASARPRWRSGTAPPAAAAACAARRMRPMCSWSMRSMTVTAGWSTATPPRWCAAARICPGA